VSSKIGLLSVLGLAVVVAACGGGGSSNEQAAKKPPPARPVKLTVPQLIERAKPAVVEISSKVGDSEAKGTGFVLDAEEGLVLTNEHVISGGTGIRARLANGQRVPMKVQAASPCDDLAVLKFTRVPAGQIKALPLGNSAELQVGARIAVMGFPTTIKRYGANSLTTTQGTVTNKELSGTVIDATLPRYDSVLQTDAAINPGNSGGPLLNEQGQVVAMATLANTVQNGRIIQGEGYGITSTQITKVLPQLRSGALKTVGWSLVPVRHFPVAALIAEQYGVSRGAANIVARWVRQEGGMLVVDTEAGEAADRAHVKAGDWLRRIGDTKVNSVTSSCDVLASEAGGAMRVKGYPLLSAGSFRAMLHSNEFKRTVKVPE
jgi:serine protease Do